LAAQNIRPVALRQLVEPGHEAAWIDLALMADRHRLHILVVIGLERRMALMAVMIVAAAGGAIGALIVLVAVMVIVMGVMVIVGGEKMRLELQNALEIEGVLLQHGG